VIYILYSSFKFVRKFKFCVSPLVKRYPAGEITLKRLCGTTAYNYMHYIDSFKTIGCWC